MPCWEKDSGSGYPPPKSKRASWTGRDGGGGAPQPMRARGESSSSERVLGGVVMQGEYGGRALRVKSRAVRAEGGAEAAHGVEGVDLGGAAAWISFAMPRAACYPSSCHDRGRGADPELPGGPGGEAQ